MTTTVENTPLEARRSKNRCFTNPTNVGKRLAQLAPEAGEKFSPNLYEYVNAPSTKRFAL